ncbi:hypothetical protein [Caenimonas aquaedulcis]|uniref:Uncharacterized protein n=1 Tax=Caenimonas aquaedulcis TaxID=2793270 RepID=A0A931H4L6_9BURK|nr:hypothetical protein [Caenimonas aquaedulcis]MBG9388466.1 hypothetical protein [Caenimonas aquaedulcis]
MDWFEPLDAPAFWRVASACFLAGSAFFFGRTLRAGRIPLIEQIARVSDPDMTPAMRRYTRGLTALWSLYFAGAAALAIGWRDAGAGAGAWVWAGAILLFVGEHQLRPLFFPGKSFPGLGQQLRDTWSVWHPRRPVE